MARVSLVELVCRVPEGWVVPNLGPVSGDPVVVRMPEVSSVVTGGALGKVSCLWVTADDKCSGSLVVPVGLLCTGAVGAVEPGARRGQCRTSSQQSTRML